MATGQLDPVLRHIRKLVPGPDGADAPDDALLRRFAAARDGDAFAALVDRHGPLVLGVCRRLLGDGPDAEDAFQATFLVLARKAGSVGARGSVAGWLYGVAVRVARKARVTAARRRKHERRAAAARPWAEDGAAAAGTDLRPVLDEELGRLPAKYRLPVVLCYLEGRTRQEAARQLGWPGGTVAGRLARARELLRRRLVRRGVGVPAGALAALTGADASAGVPEALLAATVQAAAGQGGMIAAPPGIAALAGGALRGLLMSKIKATALVLLAVAVGVGAAGLAYRAWVAGGAAPFATAAVPTSAAAAEQPAAGPFVLAGKVVDERGAPVAGIRVRQAAGHGRGPSTTTDNGGAFRLALSEGRGRYGLLLATDAAGLRQGLRQLDEAEDGRDVRITLHPARAATVHVTDPGGKPVGGARVVVLGDPVWTLATAATGADGAAVLRYPAGAQVSQVVAFKAGLGFDYRSTLAGKRGTGVRRPLPEEVALKLAGARTVRVRTVDSAGRPGAGVAVFPWYVQQHGRPEEANLSGCADAAVATDVAGVATFDWLPRDFEGPISFLSAAREYSHVDQISLKPGAPADELTMRLLRRTRLTGHVLGPDGKPAAGIRVEAAGAGPAVHNWRGHAWTRSDGSYEMLVNAEEAYVVAVVDDRWAALSQLGVLVREGQPVGGVDFRLAEGTLLRGAVTVGPDRRPVAGRWIGLVQRAGEVPVALKRPSDSTYHEVRHDRGMTTDARGRFRFRVGPGAYELIGPTHTEPIKVTVGAEREVVRDFRLPRPERGRLAGKVLDAAGKPVAGAAVWGVYRKSGAGLDIEATAAADGTFEVERVLVPAVVYARTRDRTAAGIVRIDEEQGQVTMRVGPVARARGRLLEAGGTVVAGGRVQYGIRVYEGEPPQSPFRTCFGGTVTAGPDGRYEVPGLVPGEEYDVNFEHDPENGPWSRLANVKPTGAGVIELGDTTFRRFVKPLSPEERAARFFRPRGKLAERLTRAQAEARRHYLRVLLVVGDPGDERARALNGLREGDEAVVRALLDYEQVAVAAGDAEARAVLRTYGLGDGSVKGPQLAVLGPDGKVLGTHRPALGGKAPAAVVPALRAFLAAHALPRRDADRLVADALAQARREGKRVLLMESGTYCPWCRVLTRYLDGHEAVLGPNYVTVEIDRTRFAHGEEVMRRYRKGEDHSIPWCAVLDAHGQVLANWDGPGGNIGFPGAPREAEHFLRVLRDTAPRLTAAQLADLRRDLKGAR